MVLLFACLIRKIPSLNLEREQRKKDQMLPGKRFEISTTLNDVLVKRDPRPRLPPFGQRLLSTGGLFPRLSVRLCNGWTSLIVASAKAQFEFSRQTGPSRQGS